MGEPVRLWPGVAPGSENWTHQEGSAVNPATGILAINNVVVPTLTPIFPVPGTTNGTAVVVAPGGAFLGLAWDHEGTSVARWFAERGVTAFVLKYRLKPLMDVSDRDNETVRELRQLQESGDSEGVQRGMRKAMGDMAELAITDGEQAIRLIRSRADEWGVDRQKIGMIGFSAGGSVVIGTAATTDPMARPAFVADIYGAFLDRRVPAEAPPFFGVVAADDALCLNWFLEAAHQWLGKGIPAEFHVYEKGGHGFGLQRTGMPIDSWIDRLGDWLATHRFIPVDGYDEGAR